MRIERITGKIISSHTFHTFIKREGISFVREFYGSLKVSEKWIWNIIFDAEMSNISRQHPENKI